VLQTCEAFSANRYPFPEDVGRQRQMHADVTNRLMDLSTTIESGNRRRDGVLEDIARHLNSWITIVRREKAVYNTMNMLSVDISRQALVGEAWAPVDAHELIKSSLQRATDVANASVGTVFQPLSTHSQPPTYFKTTMFTSCFQGIVESYGVARYREVNPTPFTLITFPFLFAVMFGDVGHALLMILFALVLLFFEKKMLRSQLSDTVEMIFGGRYIILLMGLFSVFTGFMYNEFFSMPMAIAGGTQYRCLVPTDDGSNYPALPQYHRSLECTGNNTFSAYTTGLEKDPDLVGTAYPFGVDPVWHGTKTELQFLNSVKMKMSIVMGVVHMSVGIFMSLFNHIYFRDRLSLIYEFIPQVIFFWSIFGYLMFLIIFKWTAWPYLEDRSQTPTTIARQPDIYGIMIDMFLKPGTVPAMGDDKVKYENNLYGGQGLLQTVLVLAALICVPIMLLPKPLILKKRHQEKVVVFPPLYLSSLNS
jgi:V-type H+-transporting ATPase subunit a